MINSTIFLDIDGTILNHVGTSSEIYKQDQRLLDGVHQKLDEWTGNGHYIVITTARPSSMADFTIKQLERFGVYYNKIIFDLPHGPRYIINDKKPSNPNSAVGISIDRDKGLSSVIIDKKYDFGIISGYFNPLHDGHLEYINVSKKCCKTLICIVNNDKQVILKNSKILLNEKTRLTIMQNIKAIDIVELSIDTDKTVAETIKKIAEKYTTFDMGGSIIPSMAFFNSGDANIANQTEYHICNDYNIHHIFLDLPKINSSSKIKEQI